MPKAWISFCVIFLGCFYSEAQTYYELPAFPGGARDDAIAELIDGNIYYGTGYDALFQPRNDFWKYSLRNQQWEQLADAPFTPRQYSASAAVGTSLFVIAGWSSPQNFHREIWRLETTGQKWTQMQDFPGDPRWGAVAAENSGLIYFGLGRDTSQRFKDWWLYYPKTDQWEALPNFPGAARNVAFAEAVNNQVWIGAGEDSAGNVLNDLWIYDTQNLTWTEKTIPNFPALKHPATAVQKDAIYIAGGEAADSLTTDLLQLKLNQDGLENYGQVGFPHARGSNMLSDGCRLYLLGGLSMGFHRINDFGVIEFPMFEAAVPVPEVYPNPAGNDLLILHPEEAKRVQVFDVNGKMLMEEQTCCDQTALSLGRLRAGSYLVRWCDEGCSQMVKFQVVR